MSEQVNDKGREDDPEEPKSEQRDSPESPQGGSQPTDTQRDDK